MNEQKRINDMKEKEKEEKWLTINEKRIENINQLKERRDKRMAENEEKENTKKEKGTNKRWRTIKLNRYMQEGKK